MLVPSIFSDNFFDDFFEFPFIDDRAEKNAERKLYGHHAANLMKTDIKEFDDKYEVEIDLPGFKKDEVQVELKDGYLVVSAEKGLDEDEKDKKSGKYFIFLESRKINLNLILIVEFLDISLHQV